MAKKTSKLKSSKAKKSSSKVKSDPGDLVKQFQKKNSQWIDNMSESSIYVFAAYGGSCTENSYTPSACCPSIGSCIVSNYCM